MNNKKQLIYLTIYSFILLFLPPIIKNINILLPLTVYSLLLIVFKYRAEFKEIVVSKSHKRIFFILLIYLLVYLLSIGINILTNKDAFYYNYFISGYSLFLPFFCIPICIYYVILYSNRRKISLDNVVLCLICAGLIQSAITIATLVSPTIKKLLLRFMYYTTGEPLYKHDYNVERRFFGFANSLLDSFGFGTGLLALLPLYYSIRNSKKWLFAIPFLLLVPLLNSRTGLVVFGIGAFIFLLYIIKNKLLKSYIKEIIPTALLLIIGVLAIYLFNGKTIWWIVGDVKSFFNRSIDGTARILFSSSFWRLPSSWLSIICGRGITIAGFGGLKDYFGFTSDVGYINEIWRTGIVGLLTMLYLCYSILKLAVNKFREDYKYLVYSFVFIALITNIKFYIISCNTGIVVILLLALFIIFEKDKLLSNKNGKLVSVIVPIYNVEDYLDKCIDSLINQSYKNIEILLINDGSPDDSYKICKKYAKLDKRIRYIEQENKGLSGARNTGIVNAKGKYLIFVDSDDYVNKYFVEKLYNAIVSTNSNLAICRYKFVYNQNANTNVYENGDTKVFESISKYKNLYNYRRDYTVVAWNKIYERDMFKNLEYPEGRIHEDQYIICDVLEKSNRVAYINEELYYYLQRDNSITGKYKFNRTDILDGLKIKMDFFERKKMKSFYYNAMYDYYYQLAVQRHKVISNYPEKKDFISSVEKEMKKYRKKVFFNVYVNPLKKIKLLLVVNYYK